jgi:hypothetical protein
MKTKKIVSCLLAAALALSGLSISAFAETNDGDYYADPATALTVKEYIYETVTHPAETETKTWTTSLNVITDNTKDSKASLFQISCTGWDYVAEQLNDTSSRGYTNYGPDSNVDEIEWTGEYLKELYDKGIITFNRDIPSCTTSLDNYEWIANEFAKLGYTNVTKQFMIERGDSYDTIFKKFTVANCTSWGTAPIKIGECTHTKTVETSSAYDEKITIGIKLSDGTEVKFSTTESCADGEHSYDYIWYYIPATESSIGCAQYVCSKCGDDTYKEFEPLSSHTHSYVTDKKDATCTEAGYTQQKCTVCGDVQNKTVIKATGHNYDSGTVTKSATCTATGTKTYTCKTCGTTKTETIPATGHDYKCTTGNATCTTSGTKTYTCTKCGDSYTETVPATNHSYDSGKITKAATCTVTGVKTYTCTVCGETKTESIPATGHSYKAISTIAPTYVSKGYTVYACTKCSSHYNSNYTAKKTLAKVKTTGFTSTVNTVTVKWNKVSNATGYRVYRYNSSTKKWDNIATIKSGSTCSYTQSKLSAGTKYYYKVIAYVIQNNKTAWGSYSDILYTSTKTKTPTISKFSTSKSSVRVYWNKVSGASGYDLQRYDSASKKWITVKSGIGSSTTNYNVTGLKKNTSYKFRIRAYKTVGSTKVYSSWSATKTAKTKKS